MPTSHQIRGGREKPGKCPSDIVVNFHGNCCVYVFLLLCMFRSVYSVSLCCSVYCLCVNVYCTVLYCSVLYCTVLYHTAPYRTFLQRGSKAVCPMPQIHGMKKKPHDLCGSRNCRTNWPAISRPILSLTNRCLSCRWTWNASEDDGWS
jgi:hypothetical protein